MMTNCGERSLQFILDKEVFCQEVVVVVWLLYWFFSHPGEEANAQKARVSSWIYLVFTDFLCFNDAKLSGNDDARCCPGGFWCSFVIV